VSNAFTGSPCTHLATWSFGAGSPTVNFASAVRAATARVTPVSRVNARSNKEFFMSIPGFEFEVGHIIC